MAPCQPCRGEVHSPGFFKGVSTPATPPFPWTLATNACYFARMRHALSTSLLLLSTACNEFELLEFENDAHFTSTLAEFEAP